MKNTSPIDSRGSIMARSILIALALATAAPVLAQEQDTIATMAAELMAVRWQVYYAADLKSKNLPHAKELSAAKLLASDLAVRAAEQAIRVHGAYGCTDDYPVARHYRDAILTTILGGTREMHKLTIGRELLGLNAMF